MKVLASRAIAEPEPLPRLQSTILTKDRQQVATAGGVWEVRASPDGGAHLRFTWEQFRGRAGQARLDDRSIDILRLYAAHKLTMNKAGSVACMLAAVIRLLRWYPSYAERTSRDPRVLTWASIDECLLEGFLPHSMKTSYRDNDLSRLRDLYRWGAFGLCLPDFDVQLAVACEAMHAPSNVLGAAVRSQDPLAGPLDADEQRLLIAAIQRRAGEDQDRALVMLFFELGMNSEAVARLWNDGLVAYRVDLVRPGGQPQQEVAYHLAVPRMKKRTEHRETRIRPISRELGELLDRLREPGELLLPWVAAARPQQRIREGIRRWVRAARIISPRTGQFLRLSPRRLRYTLATEMAREGASRYRIADMLDHSDLGHVEVYIEASSYVARQVADRFDAVFEPWLRRFQGSLVDRPTSTAAGQLPVVPGIVPQVPVLPLDLGGIGLCGRDVLADGLCRLAPH
jgi:integrase